MNDHLNKVLGNYKNKGLFIDANILLLYFVGLTNPDRIERFKRTKQFTSEDFDILKNVVRYFGGKVIVSPNVLTEVSNFIGQLENPEKSQCFKIMGRALSEIREIYHQSQEIALDPNFIWLGLTDCGIGQFSVGQYLFLTDDLRCFAYLEGKGLDVINFNNLRELGWR